MGAGQIDKSKPIIRWIHLCRLLWRCGDGRGQRELVAGSGVGLVGVDEAVTPHPHLVGCRRKFGKEELAITVSDDNFSKYRLELIGFRNYPDTARRVHPNRGQDDR